MIFADLAMVAKDPDSFREFTVVRRYGAGLAKRAEVFSRIKAEAAGITERPRPPPFIFSAMGLGGIFDHKQTAFPGDLEDRIHVCRLPKKMNRNNRLGLRCDRS